jgi:hypothetical protein
MARGKKDKYRFATSARGKKDEYRFATWVCL